MKDHGKAFKKIVVAGAVDHGKSTLLGSVLLLSGKVSDEKIAAIKAVCQKNGLPFEPAFLFDALKEEQEQGITIDTTRVSFEYEGERFIFIDAPGHIEFFKNMATGASEAEQGILVVDGTEGIQPQTRRHVKMLKLLGVRELIAVVNKQDRIGYSEAAYRQLKLELESLATEEGLTCTEVVPISALHGINIKTPADQTAWYDGLPLLPLLCASHRQALDFQPQKPFRMLVQDVYRFGEQRYVAGRVISGEIQTGSEIMFCPSGKLSTIKSIEVFPQGQIPRAQAGDSIALVLSEQVFVERGEIISSRDCPPTVDVDLTVQLAWFGSVSFDEHATYILKIGTKEVLATVALAQDAVRSSLNTGDFARASIKCHYPIAFDKSEQCVPLSQFVLCTEYDTVAAGIIQGCSPRVYKEGQSANVFGESYVDRQAFERINNHRGTVIWLTGLSGSGKSTIARALESGLFTRSCQVKVLDGDFQPAQGDLCANLGFSPEDRSENIRRMAHASRLFLDAGFITIVACISPYEDDREMARQIVGAADFNEVFVFCPLEVCQSRDPKGLYEKASLGTIVNFTGTHSPYQPPASPTLRLDSSRKTIDEEVALVFSLLSSKGIIRPVEATLPMTGKGRVTAP